MVQKPSKPDPKLMKAIAQLNKAMQKTIRSAITDLAKRLRFFPVLIDIMEKKIDEAEMELAKENENKSDSVKKGTAQMLKVARSAFSERKRIDAEMVQAAKKRWFSKD